MSAAWPPMISGRCSRPKPLRPESNNFYTSLGAAGLRLRCRMLDHPLGVRAVARLIIAVAPRSLHDCRPICLFLPSVQLGVPVHEAESAGAVVIIRGTIAKLRHVHIEDEESVVDAVRLLVER